jgi:hypothetical protein
MFRFHSLTRITKCYVFCYVTLHPIPLVGNLEILVHLISSRVNRVCRIMSFSEYDALNFLDIRYTNPSFVPKYTLIIFSETRGLAFDYILLNLLELLILKLCIQLVLSGFLQNQMKMFRMLLFILGVDQNVIYEHYHKLIPILHK